MPGMQKPTTDAEVAEFNNVFAREHDINAYYEDSGFLIRFIERKRLQLIRRLAQPKPVDRLLEVGCGGGHVLREFPECELTGVDVSSEMLAKAKVNLADFRATLQHGPLAAHEFPADSFDIVVCTEVLEHVLDPEPILAEIARVIRPGGRVVITFPNDHLINGLKDVIRKTHLTSVPPFRRIGWGGDHYHFHVWTVPEMRSLLSKHFDVVDDGFAPNQALPIRCCFGCRGR